MLKQISLLVAISIVCVFAENTAHPAPQAPAAHVIAPAPAPAAEAHAPATEAHVADTTHAAPAAEAAHEAPAAPVAELAPAATTPEQASIPDQIPAQAPETTAAPSQEALIENPIEFIIVSAIFVATVLLIALTGN